MRTLLEQLFTKQFGKGFLNWAGICTAFALLAIFIPLVVPFALFCGAASFFTIPLGVVILLIAPIWYLLRPNKHLLTMIRLALLMIGLSAVAWTTYLVGDEITFALQTELHYRAAEELITELEEYNRKNKSYPLSTGSVPTTFASRERCRKNNIGYSSQGKVFRVYFGLSSHLLMGHNYTYCSDWSKVSQESIVGQPTERLNWRLISRAD